MLPFQNVFSIPLEGDNQCLKVLEALTEIAATYSVTFITTQYIPFCVDLVEQWHKRATPILEVSLIAALRLLNLSAMAMSDHLLMSYLQARLWVHCKLTGLKPPVL